MKHGAAPKQLSRRVTLRLPVECVPVIDQAAANLGFERLEFIRAAVREKIDREHSNRKGKCSDHVAFGVTSRVDDKAGIHCAGTQQNWDLKKGLRWKGKAPV